MSYRAGSAPPELHIPPPSSSPPAEYSWEWGAFPQRSPAIHNFAPLPGQPEQRPFDRASSEPPDLEAGVAIQDGDSKPDIFGAGGRLFPDDEDEHRFWVDMEGKRFLFELSLCGNPEGKDEIGDAQRFDDARVPYRRFLDDVSMIDSENLVIRWDGK